MLTARAGYDQSQGESCVQVEKLEGFMKRRQASLPPRWAGTTLGLQRLRAWAPRAVQEAVGWL